ncbi:uncharacterized protein FIBRA_06111 [Fibroporia radiculosa]|uniref:F-box domain-containing protein n=1 Tax=Fibroporia radiculosa TaxID=599839 RepID=J4HYL5_9APHY|nr:uncharacterized protein FIBRA_06111 [Fibroporia radiculosa]CCM03957.1 predicted protein [Fibroporia radiculosa]
MSVLILPPELILEVLKLLDYRGLVLCTGVCRLFRVAIKDSAELRYKIELAADGMADGPPGMLSIAERLKLLLDRRRRWRMLDWTTAVPVPIPGACQAYELVSGVFAKSMGAAQFVGSRHLITVKLPTRTQGPTRLVREDLGVATRDFAIDPSQDIMALVDSDEGYEQGLELKVHIRTISTNEKHPEAKGLELRAPLPIELGSAFTQIVDDVVGTFYWMHGPWLTIWNWKTGEVLVCCDMDDLPPGTWDFSFLSNRAFMLTTTRDMGTIELYAFGGDTATRAPAHVATLQLPPVRLGRELQQFSTHSGPFVHATTPNKPFAVSRDSRIHFMTLLYGFRAPRFHLFVHNRFLLSFIPTDCRSGSSWNYEIRPWYTWGPDHTRLLLEDNISFQWLRYVHGQRVVLPHLHTDVGKAERTLRVLDFNVHPKRIDDFTNDPTFQERAEELGAKYHMRAEPSTVPAGAVFKHDIVTSLPYWESQRMGAFDYSGFMIDDERIIGMKSRAHASGDMTDVDVYTF